MPDSDMSEFPFLFGGTFIEGYLLMGDSTVVQNFPSFSEGLSLRGLNQHVEDSRRRISLPFRRDFH